MPQYITLREAEKMMTKYVDEKENILATPYKGLNILPISETFDKSAIETILAQTGCVSMKLYFSMDENFLVKAILVGVNSQGEDILAPGDEIIVERGQRYP